MLTKRSASNGVQYNCSAATISDEPLIERYVRDPQTLAINTRLEIESRLVKDEQARAIADFYETYYEELDGLADFVPPELERFIDTLFAPSFVIPLFPYVLQDSPTTSTQTAYHPAAAVEPVAVLVSHAPHALVCIITCTSLQQYRLYVLTTESDKRAHVLISFPELGQVIVTDAAGTANLTLHDSSIEASSFSTALLHFPIAEVELSTDQLHQIALAESSPTPLSAHDHLHISTDGETLLVHFDADETMYPETLLYVTCEPQDGEPQLFRVDQMNEPLQLTSVATDEALWLRFYA